MNSATVVSEGHQNTQGATPSLVQKFLASAKAEEQADVESWAHLLLQDASRERATDIHVDPYSEGARLRLRIDGKMREAAHLSHDISQQLINQMKVLAKRDPIISVSPVESRWQETFDDQVLDIRLTTIGCHGGEKLHARLLNRERLCSSLADLNLSADDCQILEQWQRERDGMLLVSGPTGAGKTTTLHAILRHFIDAEFNVLTIEDPVEYELDGATQIQVDESAGMTFAAGIRTMLRLDPDCMLVGELRDPDSARAAIKAAATGHTVLSTLHARDAVGSLTLLRQWGIQSGPIASLLGVVVNQRLVGRICAQCRFQREPNPIEQEWLQAHDVPLLESVWDSAGCDHCQGSGIRGRIGMFEVWELTEEERQRIAQGDDARTLRETLRQRGHKFLVDAHCEKAAAGEIRLTDLD